MEENFIKGEVLLFNKPPGWTSFQVVNKVRWLLRKKLSKDIKIGHAGTLDPLASGLLILCTGKLTRSIEEFQSYEKEYCGIFTLGATTPSYDLETSIDKTFPIQHITEQMLFDTAKTFLGSTMQIPPIFSAVKIKGERAYEKARRGETVIINPKEINISSFDVANAGLPNVEFKLCCSKGTYVRSIVRDFGEKLNSGAYLALLKRTRIGTFKLEDAWEIDAFEKHLTMLLPEDKDLQ